MLMILKVLARIGLRRVRNWLDLYPRPCGSPRFKDKPSCEAVKKAAAADLKDRHDAAGVIILALHRLEKSPEQLPVFQALLEAGADPNGA